MNFKRYRDTITASVILTASVLVSVVCYASILENLESEAPTLEPIALGKTEYNLYQGENCTGRMQVELEHEKSYHLLIDTVVKIEANGSTTFAAALVEGFFNAIGQLQAGKATLQTSNSKFVVGSEGVTPLKLNIDLKTPLLTKNFNLDLPGPIEIIETSPKIYGIRYANLSGFSGISQNISSLPIKDLKISEASESKDGKLCSKEELIPIDASKLILNLNKLLGAANPYLKEFQQ